MDFRPGWVRAESGEWGGGSGWAFGGSLFGLGLGLGSLGLFLWCVVLSCLVLVLSWAAQRRASTYLRKAYIALVWVWERDKQRGKSFPQVPATTLARAGSFATAPSSFFALNSSIPSIDGVSCATRRFARTPSLSPPRFSSFPFFVLADV